MMSETSLFATPISVIAVDDTIENLNILKEILQSPKYDLRTFRDPYFALNSAVWSPPDLFILDVSMAELSGFELCRQLRKKESLKHQAIIFVSGRSSPNEICLGLSLGQCDYVTKPFDVEELLIRIENWARVSKQLQQLKQLKQLHSDNQLTDTWHALQQMTLEYAVEYSDYPKIKIYLQQLSKLSAPARTTPFGEFDKSLGVFIDFFSRRNKELVVPSVRTTIDTTTLESDSSVTLHPGPLACLISILNVVFDVATLQSMAIDIGVFEKGPMLIVNIVIRFSRELELKVEVEKFILDSLALLESSFHLQQAGTIRPSFSPAVLAINQQLMLN